MKRVIFLVWIGALALTACGAARAPGAPVDSAALAPVPSGYAGSTNPLGADSAAAGAAVFHTNCEMCHGPRGYGDGPAGQSLEPRPRNLAELQQRAGDDFLFWRISEGKPGTAMVAWKGILTTEQIWQVVSFIRTLR